MDKRSKLHERINESEFFCDDKRAIKNIRDKVDFAMTEPELRDAETAVNLLEDIAYKDYPQD